MPEGKEFMPEIRPDEVLGGRAVLCELAQDLPEATACVEEAGAGAYAGEDEGVFGCAGKVEIEEAPAADVGVGGDEISFVALGVG